MPYKRREHRFSKITGKSGYFKSKTKHHDGRNHFSIDKKLLHFYRQQTGITTFIETGTCQGTSLNVAADICCECHSIELSQELYASAITQFAGLNCFVRLGAEQRSSPKRSDFNGPFCMCYFLVLVCFLWV
jgi:hypothetical protein